MTGQVRLRVAAPDLETARRIAATIEDMCEPPPLAVTLFEASFPAHQVDAYFDADAAPAIEEVAALLAVFHLTPTLGYDPVPDANWVALSQAALPPVTAGRFVVHGRHDRAKVGRRLNALLVEAGEAFGTAHHSTTLGCLLAIDRLAANTTPGRVLDLGCGSGVLAIAAAKVWPQADVTASDIDPIAVGVAQANVILNGARARVGCLTAAGLDHPRLRGGFDLVLANILAGPLVKLASPMRRAVRPGGMAVLSGLLVHQAAEVSAAYRAQGFHLARRHDLVGWSILELQRRV
jgi:ribosomal protein L11 methyltransferase